MMTYTLRPSEVGMLLGMHWKTIKNLPPAELPYIRVNRRGDRRYSLADVEAYIAERRVG